MRRRQSRTACRSAFALWLDAINCRDEQWLTFAGSRRWADSDTTVAVWLSWPGHRNHVLWWAK